MAVNMDSFWRVGPEVQRLLVPLMTGPSELVGTGVVVQGEELVAPGR